MAEVTKKKSSETCGCLTGLFMPKPTKVNVSRKREPAQIIDGKACAAAVRDEIKAQVEEMKMNHGIVPGLTVVIVGTRKDSQSYVRNKKKMAEEVGFNGDVIEMPESSTQAEVLDQVDKLNNDPKVHAILVQLPLPSHIDESAVTSFVKEAKDVDGFLPSNIGNLCLKGGSPPLAVPCTPAGCVEMLQRYKIQVQGMDAVVLGRSNIVGMPMAALLQSMDATVTVCHSRTKNLKEKVQAADIVVAALGKTQMIKGDWLKPGAVVIDVGINALDDPTKKLGYRLVGDVDFESAREVASWITPVPGGVGPMTIAMLLRNTINLTRHHLDLPRIPLRQISA